MNISIELFDFAAAAFTLAFMVKLFLTRNEEFPRLDSRREKISLLNQQVAPRY